LFVALWEFEVKPGSEEKFEKVYGADGAWAKLFAGDAAYRGTRLVKDVERERVYLTLDFWETREAYEEFKKENAAEYERIDRECEAMTVRENKVERLKQMRNYQVDFRRLPSARVNSRKPSPNLKSRFGGSGVRGLGIVPSSITIFMHGGFTSPIENTGKRGAIQSPHFQTAPRPFSMTVTM